MKRKTFVFGWSIFILIGYLIEILPGSDPVFEALVLALLLTWPSVLITGKRSHDTNESAWWSLLLATLYLSFLMVLVLMFKKGSLGQKDFGLPQEIVRRSDVSSARPSSRLLCWATCVTDV